MTYLRRSQSRSRRYAGILVLTVASIMPMQAMAGAFSISIASNPPEVIVNNPTTVTYDFSLDSTGFGLQAGFFINVTFSGGVATADLAGGTQMPTATFNASPQGNWNCTGTMGTFTCTPNISGFMAGELPEGSHSYSIDASVNAFSPGVLSLDTNCPPSCFGFTSNGSTTVRIELDSDGDGIPDDGDPCKFFPNTLPLVISGFSGIPDECLCGDFDGDGFHSATDAAAVNDCAAFLTFDCVSERDEVVEPIDGFYSATDADLINRVAAFIDPAYTLKCSLRPEGTCGGGTGVSCF